MQTPTRTLLNGGRKLVLDSSGVMTWLQIMHSYIAKLKKKKDRVSQYVNICLSWLNADHTLILVFQHTKALQINNWIIKSSLTPYKLQVSHSYNCIWRSRIALGMTRKLLLGHDLDQIPLTRNSCHVYICTIEVYTVHLGYDYLHKTV